jgi:hypothetical protein
VFILFLLVPSRDTQQGTPEVLASGASECRRIERRPGIENKSPLGVPATFTSERPVFEAGADDLIVGFDQGKAHFAAANEAFHRKLSPVPQACSAGRPPATPVSYRNYPHD